MLAGKPSRTALGAAMYRAAHQLVDHPPVLADPLALPIVGPEAERALRAGGARWASGEAAGLRAFVAARSRHAEDCFTRAFERGVRQHVVLGAGLDTFAYRHPYPGLRVWEVDHPATQAWKRERLALAGIPVPPGVAFAPVDLEREALGDGLARAGLDPARPAFLAWLGVTPYLSPEAIRGTLAAVAAMAPGSEVAFDFSAPGEGGPAREALAALTESAGEPLRTALEPGALAAELRALGFSRVEMADAGELDRRYFAGREDGLHLRGGRMALARV